MHTSTVTDSSTPMVAAIGECMLELSAQSAATAVPRGLELGYGGDTLNTAVYMARLGMAVEYATVLGDDDYSAWMLDRWREEGVGTRLVTRLPGRVPGLYLIRTDDGGERHFSYWRSTAPARELFDNPAQVASLQRHLADCCLLYLSGISISIYPKPAQERLFSMLGELRAAGVRVAFDSNYRPACWPDTKAAQHTITRAWGCADLALPTFEDECALFGDSTPDAALERIGTAGVTEIALKLGASGCLVSSGGGAGIAVPSPIIARPVDTTAAGDSFNAAYLCARLRGMEPQAAALQGHRLAAAVIQSRGAILPREQMPEI